VFEMKGRPVLSSRVNCTAECFCGRPKNTASQWCSECWDLLSQQSALSYSKAAKLLVSAIDNANKRIVVNRNALEGTKKPDGRGKTRSTHWLSTTNCPPTQE
jgi:hypothetical protein